MSKDDITIPGTSEIVTKRENSGTIKDGPSIFCLTNCIESGDICYFWDHRGRQIKAVIIGFYNVAGGIADILVDFISESGEKIRGCIKRYSPGLSIQYGMIGSYFYY